MLNPAQTRAAISQDLPGRATPEPPTRSISMWVLSFATLLFCTDTYGQQAVKRQPLLPVLTAAQPTTAPADIDLFDFIFDQKTCALYVAVRSAALQTPLAFGRDIDDSMVRWNKCPGGEMVACKVTPQPNGGVIVTGIPWRH